MTSPGRFGHASGEGGNQSVGEVKARPERPGTQTDRVAAIVRLLETRDDGLPTQSRRDHSIAGFVHGTRVRVTCEDCLANGRTMPGCETCRGRGYTEERRARDPYTSDKVQPYGLDPARHERSRERDAAIDRLTQQTRAPFKTPADELADANQHPEGWELIRRRMYRDFDYHALDLALETLRHHNPFLSAALCTVYEHRIVEPSATLEAACLRGLAFIDRLMPDPIRVPR